MEIVDRHDTNTYRAVYTAQFDEAIYVLHAFQKKAKRGIATPKPELDLIRRRLADALQNAGDTTTAARLRVEATSMEERLAQPKRP